MEAVIKTGTIWHKSTDGELIAGDSVRIDGENLAAALTAPIVACIETVFDKTVPPSPSDLTLQLTSSTFFEDNDPGTIFIESLIERGWLSQQRRGDALLALHEALANAIIHGNLAVAGGNAETPEDFKDQGRLIVERLATPAYGDLPVTLSVVRLPQGITISIQDCGTGYKTPDPSQESSLEDQGILAKRGRGMGLIQISSDSMTHEDNGRRLILFYRSVENDQ
jgi:hypothetical protein